MHVLCVYTRTQVYIQTIIVCLTYMHVVCVLTHTKVYIQTSQGTNNVTSKVVSWLVVVIVVVAAITYSDH